MRGCEEWGGGDGRGGAGHGPDRAGGGQRVGTLGAVTVASMAAGGRRRHLHQVLWGEWGKRVSRGALRSAGTSEFSGAWASASPDAVVKSAGA